MVAGAGKVAGAGERFLGGCERGLVAVELEEVVGGGDQPPFRPAGGSAAALEAVDAAVELGVGEHGLDGDLAFR